MADALELLKTRRSVKPIELIAPGPTAAELDTLLTVASRVPDHGKLFPWRFIVFEGAARERFGEMLVQCLKEAETVTPERAAQEAGRFLRAPVVVGVVSRVRQGIAIPEWEQQLSAGAACQTILIAAHALGFVANWLTEWCAYYPLVQERLGLNPGERIAGFIYIGKSAVELEERARPDMEKIVTRF